MLNRLQDDRLSKKYNVKVLCHGGCPTRCMYSHVKTTLKFKPKYVILNVGINDSIDSISDDILNNLSKLKRHIEKVMPFCEVIISLPTIRVDNKTANQILKNLNLKLNVTREIASNIISLIKRL